MKITHEKRVVTTSRYHLAEDHIQQALKDYIVKLEGIDPGNIKGIDWDIRQGGGFIAGCCVNFETEYTEYEN